MLQAVDLKDNKKYQDLIKVAHDLFWKHGFKRVSIEEICRDATVSKMTYYKFFPNKIELAKMVFTNVIDEGMKKFRDILDSDLLATEKMKKILLLKFEGTDNISQEFLQDFYDHSDSELSRFVDETIRRAWIVANNNIKEAQEKGLFRKNINLDFVFAFISKIDYSDPSLLKFFNTPQEMVMEILNFLMFGLSPVKNEEE